MSLVVIGTFAGLLAGAVVVGVRETRRLRYIRSLIRQLEPEHPIFCPTYYGTDFQITELNGRKSGKQPFITAIGPTEIVFHSVSHPKDAPLVIPLEQLRWFGRPKTYSHAAYLKNELWLHVESEGRWLWVRLTYNRAQMQDLIRAIKLVVPPEMITAYRRRRPYVHFGPTLAHPATQDMQGTWTLGEPLSLFLMPLYLIMLDGTKVIRKIPLDTIQRVAAVRRLDQPQAEGLVRFEVSGDPLAYAVDHHEEFATALAEAARRTLEDPVEWQRKKKKKDENLEDDELE
ncbi:MAG: hypothetical protein HY866_19480 [Chloroflexi bacterium]|nr:hypothetical protein [Chloroflexota bacterium]